MRYPIRKFTHKTRAVVLRRALGILERNEVKCIEQDTNHAHFHVEGGKTYHVEIRMDSEEVVFTHCDCPYQGIGLCKHIDAALLWLMKSGIIGLNEAILEERDFIYRDEDVEVDNSTGNDTVRLLIEEMINDPEYDWVQFLASRSKEEMLAFMFNYLEETEDFRILMFIYMWYKNQSATPPQTIVS